MKGAPIGLNQTLFLAKFPDGGMYATGPQGDMPGGPVAYLERAMAQRVADVIDGDVALRSLSYLIAWCRRERVVLYIRYPDGGTGHIIETVPDGPGGHLIKIEGQERTRLLDLAEAAFEEVT